MLTDYEIRAHQFFETRIFALAKAGKEDFLEKLARIVGELAGKE